MRFAETAHQEGKPHIIPSRPNSEPFNVGWEKHQKERISNRAVKAYVEQKICEKLSPEQVFIPPDKSATAHHKVLEGAASDGPSLVLAKRLSCFLA